MGGLADTLGMANINWLASVSSIIYWVFYGMLGLILVLAFFGIYHYLSFNIKADVFPMFGSGKDGVFSIGKMKRNRLKWTKNKTAWKKLWPLFGKGTVEPFDSEYIYPGKKVIVFELNNQWFPGRVNITQSESEIRGEINPVPYWVRNWESLEFKQNASDFAKHDFWTDNKTFIWMVLAAGICCAMVLITVWLTYKFSAGGVGAMDRLTSALQSFGGTSGAPPG